MNYDSTPQRQMHWLAFFWRWLRWWRRSAQTPEGLFHEAALEEGWLCIPFPLYPRKCTDTALNCTWIASFNSQSRGTFRSWHLCSERCVSSYQLNPQRTLIRVALDCIANILIWLYYTVVMLSVRITLRRTRASLSLITHLNLTIR